MTFSFRGHEYKYWPDAKFARAVEIPVVWPVVQRAYDLGQSILEIGNVLHNYVKIRHPVLDRFETGVTVHTDIVSWRPGILARKCKVYPSDGAYDLTVCVSTLEHIGIGVDGSICHGQDCHRSERGAGLYKPLASVYNAMTWSHRILVTFPWAYRQACSWTSYRGSGWDIC